VQGNRGIPGHVDYILPRRKPGPPGKEEVRAALVEEHRRTGASARSLARKYGVSNGTAWRWVYGKRVRPKREPDPRYPYPLPDALWQRLEPLFEPQARGAPPRYARRSLVEAIFLVLREGRPWGIPLRVTHRGRCSTGTTRTGSARGCGRRWRRWFRQASWIPVQEPASLGTCEELVYGTAGGQARTALHPERGCRAAEGAGRAGFPGAGQAMAAGRPQLVT
jgi:transposase-like protein